MLINKETLPYRMGGLPPSYYFLPPPTSVKNERLGYFPVTPPYHAPYDYALPFLPPLATTTTSSMADTAAPLYYYTNAAGKEEIASVPLSPPHTPPLLYDPATGESEAGAGASGGRLPRNSVIMKVQNQRVVPVQRGTAQSAPDSTRNDVEQQQEQQQQQQQQFEQFICQWENCYCVFFRLEDLAGHVTQQHAVVGLGGLYYCRWQNCPRPDRGFNARYKMLVHVRTHTKEKPHQCGKCGKCFSRAENLKIHLRSHSGEKPYVCPVEGCQKAYSNSSDRFKHTRTHANDKPYVCKVSGCSKRYTDPSSLRKHVKTYKHAVGGRTDGHCSSDCDPDDDAGVLIDVVTLDGCDGRFVCEDHRCHRRRRSPSLDPDCYGASPPDDEDDDEDYDDHGEDDDEDDNDEDDGYSDQDQRPPDADPVTIEDDELCGGGITTQTMEVDVPLDLSMHQR